MSDQPVEPRRIPRWIKILLGASLAVNLLIIGLAVGASWRISKSAPREAASTGFAFVAALERPDRRALLSALRDQGRTDRADRRATMAQILSTLRAETFDENALRTLIEQEQQRSARVRTVMQTEMVTRIAAMDREARLAYADRLEKKLRRGPRKGHRKEP